MALSFRKILPGSFTDSYRLEYEHLVVWLSPNSGIRQWLFSSNDGRIEEKFKSIIIDTNDDYRSIPNEQEIDIFLTAKSLSNSDFEYIITLFKSPRIFLVDKENNSTPIAIGRGKKKKDKMLKDFEIEFSIMLQEPDLMNV